MSKQTKKICARRLKITDKKEVEDLMRLYLEEEPVTKHFGLTEQDKNYIVEYFTNLGVGIHRGAGLGYFDSDTGKMIGFGIIRLPGNNDAPPPEEQISENFHKMIRFDLYVESFSEGVDGNDNSIFMEVSILKPGYRGMNIFDIYMKWLLKLAEECNYDALMTVANNSYAHNKTSQSGFIPIKTIYFKEYRDTKTGEAVLADVPPPHTRATLFIKRLKKTSKL